MIFFVPSHVFETDSTLILHKFFCSAKVEVSSDLAGRGKGCKGTYEGFGAELLTRSVLSINL